MLDSLSSGCLIHSAAFQFLAPGILARESKIIVVKGFPSPWSVAAKAMLDFKGLDFVCGPQIPGEENAALKAWSGTNSAPVVAWNDEPPVNRWDSILHLIERLEPNNPLLPPDPQSRTQVMGLAHELCGELGLGWNLRLILFAAIGASGAMPPQIKTQTGKYGFRKNDVEKANERVQQTLKFFSHHYETQRNQGSRFLVGDSLTAADFYWAAFCNLIDLPGEEVIAISPQARGLIESMAPLFSKHLDPELSAHRDRILKEHCRLPMAF